MGSQRVGHEWTTELNWSLYCLTWLSMWCSFTFCNHAASHFLFCHLGCPFYFESHAFPTIYFVWITLVKYGPPVTILHVAEQDPNAINGWVAPVFFKYILFYFLFLSFLLLVFLFLFLFHLNIPFLYGLQWKGNMEERVSYGKQDGTSSLLHLLK